MKHPINSITLNNQKVTLSEITKISSEKILHPETHEWEKELYQFLNEWFSDSDSILVQTSGSTGDPKPIKLPKQVMIRSAERTIDYFGLKKNDRLLLSLPCRYIAGKMMVVRAIVGQMNLIAVDPATDFDFLQQETFDFGAMVSNQVFKLFELTSGKEKIQNIRNLLIGGSAISAELETRISSLSNRIVSTYGMTETASHIAIRELSGDRKSAFYNCLPGISVSLGETGCLTVHLPEFDEALETNDLAEVQSATSFRILGRADSVIISGGIKFSPELIEQKLEGIINRRFIISSVPDEKLGEKLALIIEGDAFDTSTLEQKLAKILSNFERPRLITFRKKFYETASGKIIRKST